MNTRFASKKVPVDLMLAMLNTDLTKTPITKVKNSKRPKKGYTVSKLKTVRG